MYLQEKPKLLLRFPGGPTKLLQISASGLYLIPFGDWHNPLEKPAQICPAFVARGVWYVIKSGFLYKTPRATNQK